MSGRRAAPRDSGRRPLEELVRLACSTDPQEPVTRPRRLAVAPRVAMAAGVVLIILALILALRAVRGAPAAQREALVGESASAHTQLPVAETPAPQAVAPADQASASVPSQPGSSQALGQVTVHVAGAVHTPGVVVLAQGARVVDAIDAAGGANQDADTDQLNLARVLSDGERVRVPRVGETLPEQETDSGQVPPETGSGDGSGQKETAGAEGSGLVNINTASAAEMERLPGIGPALAERIVEYRQANGPFTTVDDLTKVSGIGQAKLDALRDLATV